MLISLYLGFLSLLYFAISITVIKARWKNKVSLGAGENNELLHLVSGHSNFASYVPIFLLMILALELQKFNPLILHILCIIFCVGRVIHFITMKDQEKKIKLRKPAMMLTFWPLIIAACLNIYTYFLPIFS